MDLIYINSKINNSKDKFYKYFSFPVYKIKLSLVYKDIDSVDIFKKSILSLLLSNHFTFVEIAERLFIHEQLVEIIIYNLEKEGCIDSSFRVTESGKNFLVEGSNKETLKIGYVFFDINNNRFLDEILFDNESLISNESNGGDFFRHVTEVDNIDVKFMPYVVKNEKNLQPDNIDKKLKYFLTNYKTKGKSEIISSYSIIAKRIKTNMITKLVGRVNKNEEGVMHSIHVESPLSNKKDEKLYHSLIKNISTNENLKKMFEELNDEIFQFTGSMDKKNNKETKNLIIKKMFEIPIRREHFNYIPALVDIISKIPTVNMNNTDETASQKRTALKKCMSSIGDLYESLLFETFRYTEISLDNYSKNNTSNKRKLNDICQNLNITFGEKNIFNVSKFKIENIFSSESCKLNDAIIAMLISCNEDNNYCLKQYIKNNKDFINDLYVFNSMFRNENRHDYKIIDISEKQLKKHLDIIFDLFDIVLGYKYNMQFKYEALNVKYNEVPLYTNKACEILGIELVESNDRNIISFKEHVIDSYMYYKGEESTYLLHLKPLVDSMLKKIGSKIIDELNINPYDNFASYGITKEEDFIEILKNLGFEININNLFDTELIKSLRLNNSSNKYLYNGMQTSFRKSNNRPIIQALIIILNSNKKALEYFTYDNKLYKDFFVIISSFMFVTRDHNQSNYDFNQAEADYLIENIFDIIKTFKKLI